MLSAVSRSWNWKIVRELIRTGSTINLAMKNEKEEVSLATAAVLAHERLNYTLKYGGREHPQKCMKVDLICCIPNSLFFWKKAWEGKGGRMYVTLRIMSNINIWCLIFSVNFVINIVHIFNTVA